MLAAENRFSGSRAIRQLYRSAQSVRTRRLALRYRPTQDSSWRVAVVVSKKVHKSAVIRNRIRRRLYETVRTGAREQTQGRECIVTVFDATLATAPYPELRQEVAALFAKAQLQKRQKPTGPPTKRR